MSGRISNTFKYTSSKYHQDLSPRMNIHTRVYNTNQSGWKSRLIAIIYFDVMELISQILACIDWLLNNLLFIPFKCVSLVQFPSLQKLWYRAVPLPVWYWKMTSVSLGYFPLGNLDLEVECKLPFAGIIGSSHAVWWKKKLYQCLETFVIMLLNIMILLWNFL